MAYRSSVKKKLVTNVTQNRARYMAITQAFVEFPYAGGVTITNQMWRNAATLLEDTYDQEETLARLDEMTEGGFSRLIGIFGDGQPNKFFGSRTVEDFKRVIRALNEGMKNELGDTVPVDQFGLPDIGPYLELQEEYGDFEKGGPTGKETEGVKYVNPWHGHGMIEETEGTPSRLQNADTFSLEGAGGLFSDTSPRYRYKTLDGKECAIKPYSSLDSWEMYECIVNLCAAGFEKPIRNLFFGTTDARSQTFAARSQAERNGAIMSIGSRLTAFSTEQLQPSFTPRYIVEMPNGIDVQEEGVFDDNGRFNENLLDNRKKVLVPDAVQEALLGAITSLVSERIKTDDKTNDVDFYLPEIMRELGIDPRGHSKQRKDKKGNPVDMVGELARLRYDKMMQLIAPFDRYIGIMPDGSGIYRVLAFSRYDVESETMWISTPYIYEIMRRAQRSDKAYKHRYLHGSVMNERSDAAVEVANAIICGVVRRGTLTDKSQGRKNVKDERRVSYDRTYVSLIQDCPTLRAKLESIEQGTTKNKNQVYNNALKYTFQSAFRIIAEKSDLPDKYTDLHLPVKMETVNGKRRRGYGYPTKSTLKQRMDIWHHGRAPK